MTTLPQQLLTAIDLIARFSESCDASSRRALTSAQGMRESTCHKAGKWRSKTASPLAGAPTAHHGSWRTLQIAPAASLTFVAALMVTELWSLKLHTEEWATEYATEGGVEGWYSAASEKKTCCSDAVGCSSSAAMSGSAAASVVVASVVQACDSEGAAASSEAICSASRGVRSKVEESSKDEERRTASAVAERSTTSALCGRKRILSPGRHRGIRREDKEPHLQTVSFSVRHPLLT